MTYEKLQRFGLTAEQKIVLEKYRKEIQKYFKGELIITHSDHDFTFTATFILTHKITRRDDFWVMQNRFAVFIDVCLIFENVYKWES